MGSSARVANLRSLQDRREVKAHPRHIASKLEIFLISWSPDSFFLLNFYFVLF